MPMFYLSQVAFHIAKGGRGPYQLSHKCHRPVHCSRSQMFVAGYPTTVLLSGSCYQQFSLANPEGLQSPQRPNTQQGPLSLSVSTAGRSSQGVKRRLSSSVGELPLAFQNLLSQPVLYVSKKSEANVLPHFHSTSYILRSTCISRMCDTNLR